MEVHVGGALASGDLKSNFRSAPSVGGGFGYRFMRNAQVEGAFDAAFGAARFGRNLQVTGGGTRSSADREYFLTLGGRLILPAYNEKLLWSFGGGLAVMNYNEVPLAGLNEVITCTSCASREGVGTYLLFGVKGMVTPRYGLGITVRSFQATTEGSRFNTQLPSKSKDQWTSVAGTFSFHW